MKTKLFLFTIIVSAMAWSQTYESRAKCDVAFKAAQPKLAGSSEANEKFCFGRYPLSADEMKWATCVEEKMRKSYGANYNVNDNVGKIARANFKSECLRATEYQTALTNQQQQAQAAAQQAAQNQANGANANNPLAQGGTLGTVMQMAPVAIAAYQAMGKGDKDKKPAASSGSGGSGSAAPGGGAVGAAANQSIHQANQNAGLTANNQAAVNSSSDQMGPPAESPKIDFSNNRVEEVGPPVQSEKIDFSKINNEETVAASQNIQNNASDVANIDPSLNQPVQGMVKAQTSEANAVDPKTQISENDRKVSEAFIKNVKSVTDVNLPTSPNANFSQTNSYLKTIYQSASNYKETPKDECTKSAERATFLCAEGTSPGAKAAKMLLDYGGPVLGAMSSAQKTCSSTQKIMNFATMGLTAAKGVCVGAKVMCDKACNGAVKFLGQVNKQVQQARAQFNLDLRTSSNNCQRANNPPSSDPSCGPQITQAQSVAQTVFAKLDTVMQKEAAPSEGTAQSRVVHCQGLMKDVLLLAANAASTLMAANSAKKCKDQLSSNPGNGSPTMAQYCDQPANVSLEICKCQRNNMAPGCPGALASNNSNNPNYRENNIKPINPNIKPTANGSPSGSGNNNNTNIGKTNDPANSSYSSTGGLAGGFNAPGAGSLGSASDAAGNSADKDSSEVAKDKKNKWNLGGLSDYVGGLFGKGGAESGSGSKLGLGSKDADALKRQIASENFRAEVSTASGKSNWEKVRQMYLIKNPTFVSGR